MRLQLFRIREIINSFVKESVGFVLWICFGMQMQIVGKIMRRRKARLHLKHSHIFSNLETETCYLASQHRMRIFCQYIYR